MNDCIFCKIIKGEIPCYKIYEDDNTLAFLDISNDLNGHTLVIPKQHYINIFDATNDVLNNVMNTVKKICEHYKSIGFDGVNIINANDISAGQSVFHLHIHILPRKNGDGVNAYPNLKGADKTLEQMHTILKMY